MRRLVHAALILLMVAVVPTATMAEYCGGSAMRCCTKSGTADVSLSRPGCCTAPCFDKAADHREPASETRPVRLDAPGAAAVPPASVSDLALSVAEVAVDPAVSPPLGRRLASLSILLI